MLFVGAGNLIYSKCLKPKAKKTSMVVMWNDLLLGWVVIILAEAVQSKDSGVVASRSEQEEKLVGQRKFYAPKK